MPRYLMNTRYVLRKLKRGMVSVGLGLLFIGINVVDIQLVEAKSAITTTSNEIESPTDSTVASIETTQTIENSETSNIFEETTTETATETTILEETSTFSHENVETTTPIKEKSFVDPKVEIVTKDNFKKFFNLNAGAIYDPVTGIITLTPDLQSQKGSFSLNSKIDMSRSFTLKGKINLGNKAMNQGGADGIGFIFHSNSTTDLGSYGGGLGFGGLADAVGFKFDTWYNAESTSTFTTDPEIFFENMDKIMQAFVYTDANGVAHTSEEAIHFLKGPSHNEFHDISINYDGIRKLMIVSYTDEEGMHTYTENLSHYLKDNQNYTFSVSGSTGKWSNLQQFQLEEFVYAMKSVVNVDYIDKITGQKISQSKEYQGNINEEIQIANLKEYLAQFGYSFDSVVSSDNTHFDEMTDKVILTSNGQNIIYYFIKSKGMIPTSKPVETKVFDETVISSNDTLSGTRDTLPSTGETSTRVRMIGLGLLLTGLAFITLRNKIEFYIKENKNDQ